MGQDTRAIRKNYDWGDKAPWKSEWATSTRTEILDDDLSVRLKRTKPQFLAIFFERKQVIHFARQEDIIRYGRFVLPESLDPAFDRRYVPYAAQPVVARPLWFNVRLDHFVARIIRPDGTWGEVGAFAKVDHDRVRTFQTMENAWSYVLDLQAIAPGDVVEIRWKYMVPYDVNGNRTQGWRAFQWVDNWTRLTNWRLFFHGVLPIQHQTVELKYHKKHGLSIGTSSFYSVEQDGDGRTLRWEHHDLPGCMDEVNARPSDLPHLAITLAPEDFRYWRRDRLSGLLVEQPYWLYVLRMREARALWWKQVSMKHVPDRQNALLNEFVERTTLGIPEGSIARKMEALHNTIAADFTYKDDSLWYQEVDRGLPRIGDNVAKERIREISRYDLYAKLVYGVDGAYSTAYVMDKRIGAMDDRWMGPLWDNDLLFGVNDDGRVLWMHPKRGGVGLWANELPFYWQGSSALLMNTDILTSDAVPAPLFYDLPVDGSETNLRVVESALDVALASGAVEARTRVLLSGQFSTLGRGAYILDAIDPLVDPRYGDAVHGLFGRSGAWQVRSNSSVPPFRFQTVREGVSPLSVTKNGKELSLELSPTIGHAVPERFSARDRDLPFYWDFAQNDRVIIDLHFDGEVEFLGLDELNVTVSTPNATLVRTAVSDAPDHVRIESTLTVHGVLEEVGDAAAVEALIHEALARDLVLRFTPLVDQQ